MSKAVERFKQINAGHEIGSQEGNFSYLLLGSVLPFVKKLQKYQDTDFGALLFAKRGPQRGTVFYDAHKYAEVTEKAMRQSLELDSVHALPELTDFAAIQRKAARIYRQYPPERLTALDTERLGALLKTLYGLWHDVLAATVFSEALDESLMGKFYAEFGGTTEGFKEFSEHASLVHFQSFLTRLDAELAYQAERGNLHGLHWVFCDYNVAPSPDSLSELAEERLGEIGGAERARLNAREALRAAKANRELAELFGEQLSPRLRQVFKFVQHVLYVRDIRKEALHRIGTLISNAAREVLGRLGIDPELVTYVYSEDFAHGTPGPEYASVLTERAGGAVLCVDLGGSLFHHGSVDEQLSEVYRMIDGEAADTLKGNTGCPGSAAGPARIILDTSEFAKFNEGDVLVTSMTRPEFVPLMKRASAIVTDEGGITCHAAIVSRELKKPCIIGTKRATRVLQDGEHIRVDATNGIITKL